LRARLKILFLSDTHLGIDSPSRPRVERSRRGPDFFANYLKALEPAFDHRADIVLHGGDLFYRSRIRASLVDQAFDPLRTIAESGTPVLIVPGNHERSKIPYGLLAEHPGIKIFRTPGIYHFSKNGITVLFGGFPYIRNGIGEQFKHIVQEIQLEKRQADFKFLCMHQIVEGATVGPGNFLFDRQPDVIPAKCIPSGIDAVLSGHIHRHQILRHDLKGNPMDAPVYYPGSIERTAFAEMSEPKGFLLLECRPSGSPRIAHEFVRLPARPMCRIRLNMKTTSAKSAIETIESEMLRTANNCMIRIDIAGAESPELSAYLKSCAFKRLVSSSMLLSIRISGDAHYG
jgi:DNA repair protein SbcD/Mre11